MQQIKKEANQETIQQQCRQELTPVVVVVATACWTRWPQTVPLNLLLVDWITNRILLEHCESLLLLLMMARNAVAAGVPDLIAT